MLFALISGLFVLYRIIDFVTAIVAPYCIPFLGFFPYRGDLEVYPEPTWLSSFANFDGIHYMIIAGQGYQPYEEAYFPLYPILMRYAGMLLHNDYFLAGFVISNGAFLFGLWLFRGYVKTLMKQTSHVLWTVLFLLVFPTSFFFGAVYTEGLFLFTAGGYLYCIAKKKYAWASLFGYFAALTRLVGVFLIIPFFVEIYVRHWQKVAAREPKQKPASLLKQLSISLIATLSELARKPARAVPFFTPLLGLLSYMGYLAMRTGDPFYFFTAQPMFGAQRSTHLILLPQVFFRYIKIFITARHNYQYLGALIEFTIFTFVFCLLLWELWRLWKRRFDEDVPTRLGLNLFSLANIILPTLTGTLTSTPRYALFSLSIFLVLGEMKNTVVKVVLAVVFALLHLALLGLFIQGYFVG